MIRRHGELARTSVIVGDAVAAVAAGLLAYVLRFHTGLAPVLGSMREVPARYLEALPVAVGVMLGAAALAGMYGRERLLVPATIRGGIRTATVAGFAMAALALVYWKQFQYSRLAIAMAAAVFGVMFVAGRAATAHLVRRMRRAGRFRSQAVLVGGGKPAAALQRAIGTSPWLGIEIAAVLPIGETPAAWSDAAQLHDMADLCDFVERGLAREVFVAVPAAHADRLGPVLSALNQVTADVRVVPDLGDAMLVNPDASVLAGLPVVSVRERPLYGLRAGAKRSLDLIFAFAILVALAPVALALAFLVKLTSRGPVLFRQERMGLDGHPFAMLKFRTMRLDAEEDTGPVFAIRDDPRTTTLGRFLRRFSLDEIPQLWNVLLGQMSLVGPRPERAPFIAEFRSRLPGYMLRHSVKAGMTGWAQVHGLRGESSIEDRLRYDLEYIDRWSLLLDLEILVRTLVQVVVGRNAY